ncbi:response regulator [Roseateles cellulosilyticus]|uniref:response regulator n=1 Tax=Pelomonas cellulosilytica TaxID=2906762 RepID=UPI0032C2168A
MHILLIEDDLDLGHALQAALRADGHSSTWLRRCGDAPVQLDPASQDAVLLDQTLPDGDGRSLLKRWRRQGSMVPVLVITARVALEDRLAGFDGGADDYVVKPFEMPELIARLRAVLRRCAQQASDEWTLGDLTIEPRRQRALLDGAELALSPREYQLLLELARERGSVVPKQQQLAQRLAPLGEPLEFGTLEVHLANLRRKIGAERIGTARASMALGESIMLFGKLGVAANRLKADDSLGHAQRETCVRPMVGGGLAWQHTPRMSAAVEYNRYGSHTSEGSRVTQQKAEVGLAFKF